MTKSPYTPPAMVEPEPRFPHGFITAVFSHDWHAQQHVEALYGWFMRQHADAEHPEAIEDIAQRCIAGKPAELRDAWLFGYRFRDTPAPGGEGVGNERGSGT